MSHTPKRFQALLAVSLFLINNGKILLGRRCNTSHGNGEYGLVSGHIDGNESATYAMIREAQEEVGINIDPQDLKVVHVQHLNLPPEYVNFFFIAQKWQGTPTILEPHKCDDLQWFDLDKLPENMGKNIVYALRQYQDNKFYSEFGWD